MRAQAFKLPTTSPGGIVQSGGYLSRSKYGTPSSQFAHAPKANVAPKKPIR